MLLKAIGLEYAMKICILTERMRAGFGVDLVVDEQAKQLVRQGFDVTVVVLRADLVQPERHYRLIVIERLIFRPDYGTEKSVRNILKKCAVDDSDIWILHTAPFYEWIPWLDGPVIAVEHGTPPGSFFSTDLGKSVDDYSRHRLYELYAHLLPFDKIISISHAVHDWLPGQIRPLSRVIHNGADHYKKVGQESVDALRSNLGVKANGKIILWVGRMQLENDEQPYKGFQELLAIAPEIISKVSHCTFALAGRLSAHDFTELTSLGFRVLGNLSSEELSVAIAAADVMLNVSRWEGFNLTLLEAQYQGTPVVAYDFGPHREIVLHGQTGILASDAAGIVEATVKIANDKKLRQRLSAEARSFSQTFTWDKNATQLAEVIHDCSGKAPPRSDIRSMRRRFSSELAENKAGYAGGRENAAPAEFQAPAAAVKARKQFVSSALKLEWPKLNNHGLVRQARRLLQGPKSKLGPADRDLLSLAESTWFKLEEHDFVRQAFRALLGREAEQSSVVGYSARLKSGESRSSILAEIRFSQEGSSRPLYDPELVSLIARECVRKVQNPEFDMEKLRRGVNALSSEVWDIHAKFESIQDVFTKLNDPFIKSAGPAFNGNYETAGLEATLNYLTRKYTILVAAGARINRQILDLAWKAIDGRAGGIIYGDVCETLPDGRSRLIVTGPFCEESFDSWPNLGGCVFVHNDLLDRLHLSRSSVLTPDLLRKVVRGACAISYVPVILSEWDTAVVARQTEENSKRKEISGGTVGSSVNRFEAGLANADLSDLVLLVIPSEMEESSEGWFEAIEDLGRGCGEIIALVRETENIDSLRMRSDKQGLNLILKTIPNDVKNNIKFVNEIIRSLPSSLNKVALMERDYVLSTDVIHSLARTAARINVGAVSPRALDQSGRTINAGIAVNKDFLFSYVYRYGNGVDIKYEPVFPQLNFLREVTAVSGGCLVFRRAVFDLAGGFDEYLNVHAAIIDFCLEVRSYELMIMVDGRCDMMASDANPKWGLDFTASDVLRLIARHSSWIGKPDEFWIERKPDGHSVSIRCLTKSLVH